MGSVRSSRTELTLLLALAVVIAGCGDDDDKPAAANPLSVEIRGTDLHPEGPPSLVHGQSFTLLGIVYGGTGATPVQLYANPYPHHAWRAIDSTRARSDFVFRIRPERNTRYQLRVEGRPRIRSRVQPVYVDLKGKLTAALPKPGMAELRYIGSGSGAVKPGRGLMHFYVREANRGPLRRVGTGAARQQAYGSVVVSVRYPEASPEQSDRFVSCTVGQLADGYGHPRPADLQCGRRALQPTEQRLNAPG
jgi:hypothetical protein